MSTGSETICGSTAETVPTNMTATPAMTGVNWRSCILPERQLWQISAPASPSVSTAISSGSASQGETPYSKRRSPCTTVMCGSVIKTLPMLSTVITSQKISSAARTKAHLDSV